MRMVFPPQNAGRLLDDLATDVGTLVETILGDATNRPSREPAAREVSMRVPMDVEESGSCYTVTLDVPGVPIESVELDVHEDTLSIRGSRPRKSDDSSDGETAPQGSEASAESSPEVVQPLRRERAFGQFERTVRLPLPVENDAVTAELSDGVLVVTLPKADPDKGKRRVPVSRK